MRTKSGNHHFLWVPAAKSDLSPATSPGRSSSANDAAPSLRSMRSLVERVMSTSVPVATTDATRPGYASAIRNATKPP